MSHNVTDVAQCIKKYEKILITTHLGPDGDALGSSRALWEVATKLGKDAKIIFFSKVPAYLSWFTFQNKPAHSIDDLDGWVPDLLAVVDSGAANRPGDEIGDFFAGKRPNGWENVASLQIDHHVGNSNFADCNWVDPTAGATCELMARLTKNLDIPLSGSLGEAVYLGIVSDTGNFSYSNTSPDVLQIAADIIAKGLDVAAFTEKNENNWTLARMQLWGELLQDIRLYADGRVVTIMITNAILKKHDCLAADLEGFVSFIRKLQSVEVSMLVREKPTTGCKISLRSQGGAGSLDVQAIASQFGGGGHKAASGIEIAKSVTEAHRMVLGKILEAMGDTTALLSKKN